MQVVLSVLKIYDPSLIYFGPLWVFWGYLMGINVSCYGLDEVHHVLEIGMGLLASGNPVDVSQGLYAPPDLTRLLKWVSRVQHFMKLT